MKQLKSKQTGTLWGFNEGMLATGLYDVVESEEVPKAKPKPKAKRKPKAKVEPKVKEPVQDELDLTELDTLLNGTDD